MKGPKPFEERPCTECSTPYKHYATTKHHLCSKCRNRLYARMQRLTPEERKKPYPLNKSERRSRYRRMIRELNNCLDRGERIEQLKKNIDEMVGLGIWTWCEDVRLPQPPKGYDRAGRQKAPKNEYPDTRNAEL
jgi:hypothetical protein